MKLIVGLGNPGKEYALTRHNVGFMAIDELASHYSIDVTKSKFKGLYGEGIVKGEKIVLLKPLTYKLHFPTISWARRFPTTECSRCWVEGAWESCTRRKT